MIWSSLSALMTATRLEFTPALEQQHNFLKLPSGKWMRVLGAPPKDAIHIRGRFYHVRSDRR